MAQGGHESDKVGGELADAKEDQRNDCGRGQRGGSASPKGLAERRCTMVGTQAREDNWLFRGTDLQIDGVASLSARVSSKSSRSAEIAVVARYR